LIVFLLHSIGDPCDDCWTACTKLVHFFDRSPYSICIICVTYVYVLNTTKRVLAHTHRGISMYVRLYTYIYSAGPRVSVWGGVTWCVFMAINSRSAIASPPTIIKNKVHLVWWRAINPQLGRSYRLFPVIYVYICAHICILWKDGLALC